MSKLKTLKDLSKKFRMDMDFGQALVRIGDMSPELITDMFSFGYYDAEELRIEVIKWIKAPDMTLFEYINPEDRSVHDVYMLKEGLKKFFNITEEDLVRYRSIMLERSENENKRLKSVLRNNT